MEESLKSSGEKIIDNLTSRLKIPIIATYVIVLGFQNWDIIYFIVFAKLDVIDKIHFIKINYSLLDYVCRVFGSLLYAIFLLVLFTLIDFYLIKYLKEFSIGKKNIQEEIASANLLKEYQTKYEKQLIEIETSKSEIDKLDADKKSLISLIEDLNEKDIQNSDALRIGEIILEIKARDSNISLDDALDLLIKILKFIQDEIDYIDLNTIKNYVISDISNYNKVSNENSINGLAILLINMLVKLNYLNFDRKEKTATYIVKNNDELDKLYKIMFK